MVYINKWFYIFVYSNLIYYTRTNFFTYCGWDVDDNSWLTTNVVIKFWLNNLIDYDWYYSDLLPPLTLRKKHCWVKQFKYFKLDVRKSNKCEIFQLLIVHSYIACIHTYILHNKLDKKYMLYNLFSKYLIILIQISITIQP